MTTRATLHKAISLFVFTFLYFLLSCGGSGSITKNNAKSELIKIHLVIADNNGKRLFDTIYPTKLVSPDTFRIQPMYYTVPDRTGGSSPCTVQMEVWKDDDDDDDKN